MNRDDTLKTLQVTRGALQREFGNMADLRYEIANMVANIYFRYFEQGFSSCPPLSDYETFMRHEEFEKMPALVSELRYIATQEVAPSEINLMSRAVLARYKYRISDVGDKTSFRLMLETKLKKDRDFPNLIRDLDLYQ